MLSYQSIRDNMKYVPFCLSNKNIHGFDNQKALFRSIHWIVNDNERYEKFKNYSFRDFHVLAIDLLLYGLARFGYVLKENKSNVDFMSFHEMDKEYRKMSSLVFSNALSKQDDVCEWKKMEVPTTLIDWIETNKYLPVEFRDNETLNLSLAFLVASISVDDNYYINKLKKEERLELCIVVLELMALFGFSVYKIKKEGDFDNFTKYIAPYRKSYKEI